MAHSFRLSTETIALVNGLRDRLNDETQEHRDAYDDRSDSWRESEKGEAVDTWLAMLDEVIDTLEDVPEKPES